MDQLFAPDIYFAFAIAQKLAENGESALTFRAASENFSARSIG
jgi:hypothetical protein